MTKTTSGDHAAHPGFFWYQARPETAWIPAPASERANILRTKQPALATALDADNDFSAPLTKAEQDRVRYSGDYYADFDSETLESAIVAIRAFLDKLRDHDVNLDQCRVYATGGRGFHLFVPAGCFMRTAPDGGVAMLPAIYKAMATELYVDDLDLRVYTAKRGRMLRCANVRRENGAYKVRVSVHEVETMTPALFAELCQAPRPDEPASTPSVAEGLTALYERAAKAVQGEALKINTKPPSATAGALHARFTSRGIALPPSLLILAAGQIRARDGVGFNHIAMQLAIAANAMGLSENDLVAISKGLIEKHHGDGTRYNTPAKRERELRAMYNGVDGYEFSPGAIRALFPDGCPCNDLKGL